LLFLRVFENFESVKCTPLFGAENIALIQQSRGRRLQFMCRCYAGTCSWDFSMGSWIEESCYILI